MLKIAVFLLVINIFLFIFFFILLKIRFSPKRLLRDIEDELNLLYKDLQHKIDMDVSLIEDRTAFLRDMIAKADKRILLAASEIEKRKKTVSAAVSPPSSVEEQPVPEGKTVYTRRQISENAAAAEKARQGAFSPRTITPEIPVREQVVNLARKDISPEEIAKILSLPRSEVDFILALDL